ncbi:MAG: site-2 protease family protein [Acidobacteriia bacterium]|nr:site-2 protease family protein [Terriglobia bacterium]
MPPRRERTLLHLSLFAATGATLLLAGAMWEGAFDRLSSIWMIPRFVMGHPTVLVSGVPYAISILAILASHEMGHYLACRWYGIPATLPFFIPGIGFGTFGAVIRIRGVIPDRKALFDVAAAGPLAGFSVALPILIWGLLRATPVSGGIPPGAAAFGSPLLSLAIGHFLFGGADLSIDSIYIAGWFGMLITSMNLFPVGQLDGGHAVYALSRRWHRLLARGTLVTLIALVAVQTILYRTLSAYTLWCVVLLLMRDRHPRLEDEITPLGPGRRLGLALLLLIFLICFIPVPLSL